MLEISNCLSLRRLFRHDLEDFLAISGNDDPLPAAKHRSDLSGTAEKLPARDFDVGTHGINGTGVRHFVKQKGDLKLFSRGVALREQYELLLSKLICRVLVNDR